MPFWIPAYAGMTVERAGMTVVGAVKRVVGFILQPGLVPTKIVAAPDNPVPRNRLSCPAPTVIPA